MKKKKIKVSIIIPVYNPNKILLNKLLNFLKKNVKNDTEILVINGKNGLANAYNKGIKKSKGEIVITIHSDCLPLEKDGINKLITPILENEKIVLTNGLLYDRWSNKKFFPEIPDGKFTAYRKSSLKEVGFFNEKIFFTGGEDVDIYLKLKKIGRCVNVNTPILHDHPYYFGNKTIEKRKQNGSINGCLFRIWGFKNPKWFKALILCFLYPLTYGKYFLKGFIKKKQDYRRGE